MKRILLSFFVCALILSLSACQFLPFLNGVSVNDDGITITDEDGNEVNISTSDDGVVISDENGKIETGSDLEWPADYMGDLPELNGKIDYVVTSDADKSAAVTMSGIHEEDAVNYLSEIKNLGYSGTDMSSSEQLFFAGTNTQKDEITFNYTYETKEVMIIFNKS